MKRLLLVLFLLLLLGCRSNPPEHNRIVFRDSTATVVDSLRFVVGILDTLRARTDIEGYFMSAEDTFEIFTSGDISPKRGVWDTTAELELLSRATRFKFLSAIRFLRVNHMTGCFLDYQTDLWFFHYRHGIVIDYDDRRWVVPIDHNVTSLRRSKTILEEKGGLVLVADKDAKIY